jgi:hypothetical protein
MGLGGHPLGSQAQTIRICFSPQKGFITNRNTPQFHQLSGWLVAGEEARYGGPGLAWLHVVCRFFKFCKTALEPVYGREFNIKIIWQQLWWTFMQPACQLHTPSKIETSVALCCVTKLHILECPFIVTSTRCTCVMIMLWAFLWSLHVYILRLYFCSIYLEWTASSWTNEFTRENATSIQMQYV